MLKFSVLEIIAIVLLIIITGRIVLSVFKGIWTCFLGHFLGFGIKWRTGDNMWAVITGATDGIGFEYAKQLAKIGYNLVIISRNEDKLKTTQTFLKENYKKCKKVNIICVDFIKTDIYEQISSKLNELEEVYVLVNNVGAFNHYPEYYFKVALKFRDDMLNINSVSAVRMIDLVLPKMIKKKRGIIINISSQICEHPLPLYTSYAATKSFLTSLSLLLSVEYEPKGVYIQTVVPNLLKTKQLRDVDFPIMPVDPKDWVSAAIKTVGIEHYTYGHWKHKLLAYLTEILIDWIGNRIFMKIGFLILLRFRRIYLNKVSNV